MSWSHRRAGRLAGCLALLLCLLCLPALASAFERPLPWRLALVVDGSADMAAPWQGTSRLAALQKALQVELRSLPLRVTCGVWLSRGGKARLWLPPAPAARLKGLQLRLPAPGGQPSLAAGIKAGTRWLAKRGGGSLLVIGARSPGAVEIPPSLFLHLLALDPKDGGPGLGALALAGGGALYKLRRRDRMALLLHQAVRLAISPARLRVICSDAHNRRQASYYRLGRKNDLSHLRRGLCGRVVQVLPGSYRLVWPPGHRLGPGPLPAGAACWCGPGPCPWS